MKEAIGGVSLFQIVIIFILLFTGIMCLTINHAKAFGVKDEIITIIQNEEINELDAEYNLKFDTLEKIANHLEDSGYRTTGTCPDGWTGYNRDGVNVNDNASFCIKATNAAESFYNDLLDKCSAGKCNVTSGDYPVMVYYDVMLFYQLDIPVINNLMQFKIVGSTKILFG